MGAFDKIKSGLPAMDELLNYIRMGDNVVWSVSDLEDFKFFAVPFAEQAVRDGRNLIYMRFADHEPILTPRPGLKICEFDPDKGFEAFTVDIHDRFFSLAKLDYQRGFFSGETERQIIESTLTKDRRLQEMIRNILNPMIPSISDRMSFIRILCPTTAGRHGLSSARRKDILLRRRR